VTGSLPAKLALLSVLPLFQTDAKVLEKVLAKDDAAFVKELSRAGTETWPMTSCGPWTPPGAPAGRPTS
jgi:hypothetical protein